MMHFGVQNNNIQGSNSPLFYKQFLCKKIPKVQKDTDNLTVFFALLGSVRVKAAHKNIDKIDPR
jgi:hypothetical protein